MGILNRRHLRIKVLQALYAYFQSDEDNYVRAEKDLVNSIEKMYDLYLYLLLTYGEVRDIALHRIEENKKKLRPTEEDLHPNRKFVDNEIIESLENSAELRKKSEERKINWQGDENKEMFRKMFLAIKESETYIHHMNVQDRDFEEEKTFAIDVFKNEIANFELLHNFFEEKSIQWLDDIDLVCSMVIKTIKQMENGEGFKLLPLYKEDDDEQEFIRELFKKTVSMNFSNEKLIDELTENWELERIAKMDIILMKMAVTELQIFPSIPTKVTLNEYIEISKFYSTPKSNGFINGILDKAIDRLTKEGLIRKTGRGLMQ
jgi:N utilization substance protein B